MPGKPKTIDEYLAALSDDKRAALEKLRKTIRAAAPKAEECISYQLPASSRVTVKVYDILGREVATLVDGMKEAGYYTATFDGSRLSSGIYITRFLAQPQEGNGERERR